MTPDKPDLSGYVDLTEEEVLALLTEWKDAFTINDAWDTDPELAYVLVTSLVRKHFKETAE